MRTPLRSCSAPAAVVGEAIGILCGAGGEGRGSGVGSRGQSFDVFYLLIVDCLLLTLSSASGERRLIDALDWTALAGPHACGLQFRSGVRSLPISPEVIPSVMPSGMEAIPAAWDPGECPLVQCQQVSSHQTTLIVSPNCPCPWCTDKSLFGASTQK